MRERGTTHQLHNYLQVLMITANLKIQCLPHLQYAHEFHDKEWRENCNSLLLRQTDGLELFPYLRTEENTPLAIARVAIHFENKQLSPTPKRDSGLVRKQL